MLNISRLAQCLADFYDNVIVSGKTRYPTELFVKLLICCVLIQIIMYRHNNSLTRKRQIKFKIPFAGSTSALLSELTLPAR